MPSAEPTSTRSSTPCTSTLLITTARCRRSPRVLRAALPRKKSVRPAAPAQVSLTSVFFRRRRSTSSPFPPIRPAPRRMAQATKFTRVQTAALPSARRALSRARRSVLRGSNTKMRVPNRCLCSGFYPHQPFGCQERAASNGQ
jgi:hypothetical protein